MPNEYEQAFKEEIWGCYKYIGIPLETIYNMPIQERKYYIVMHNKSVQAENNAMEQYQSGEKTHEISGEALNDMAIREQQKNGGI